MLDDATEKMIGNGTPAAIDQVSDQRGEQSNGRACPPVVDSSQNQGQKSQRAHVPPDQTKQKSPGNTEPNAGGLIAEQKAVGHTDSNAYEKVDDQAATAAETGVEPGNLRQNSGCSHDRNRD